MPISSSDAQQNVIGNCSQENVLKLIDAGYDKLGIARICGKIPSAAMNKVNRPVSNKPQSPNTSKPSASPPDRTDRVDLATLDGTWGMEVACSPYSGASTTLQASNGLITGPLWAGEDTLQMNITIEINGTVSGYGTGNHVMGVLNGNMSDWKSGKAQGGLTANGEAFCEGQWTLRKIN